MDSSHSLEDDDDSDLSDSSHDGDTGVEDDSTTEPESIEEHLTSEEQDEDEVCQITQYMYLHVTNNFAFHINQPPQ